MMRIELEYPETRIQLYWAGVAALRYRLLVFIAVTLLLLCWGIAASAAETVLPAVALLCVIPLLPLLLMRGQMSDPQRWRVSLSDAGLRRSSATGLETTVPWACCSKVERVGPNWLLWVRGGPMFIAVDAFTPDDLGEFSRHLAGAELRSSR